MGQNTAALVQGLVLLILFFIHKLKTGKSHAKVNNQHFLKLLMQYPIHILLILCWLVFTQGIVDYLNTVFVKIYSALLIFFIDILLVCLLIRHQNDFSRPGFFAAKEFQTHILRV